MSQSSHSPSNRTPRKALFLDRDGVINRTVFRRGQQRAPQDMSEWAWLEGVHDTLVAVRERGYWLFVVTNQPDVRRGWQSREQVDEFHDLIARELPVARIYACFHDNGDACSCRKPRPGMLLSARDEFGVHMPSSFMIGDRPSDIEAGRAAGCGGTIFMEHEPGKHPDTGADYQIHSLPELLDILP